MITYTQTQPTLAIVAIPLESDKEGIIALKMMGFRRHRKMGFAVNKGRLNDSATSLDVKAAIVGDARRPSYILEVSDRDKAQQIRKELQSEPARLAEW